MKVLIFADSHGYNMAMAFAVDREEPDAVIHLGDHAEDAREIERVFPAMPMSWNRPQKPRKEVTCAAQHRQRKNSCRHPRVRGLPLSCGTFSANKEAFAWKTICFPRC